MSLTSNTASSIAATAMIFLSLLTTRYRAHNLYQKIKGLDSKVWSCYQNIEQAFHLFKPDELALAFNGGKDCLVVFRLCEAYVKKHGLNMPQLVYFEKEEEEFPELLKFMNETANKYNLPILTVKNGYKKGLEIVKQKGYKGIFMGQRRTDPYAPNSVFAKTTEGWPEVVRINPILDLDYAGVWTLLRGTNTEYCSLYDAGYTSIGPKNSTLPNKKLSTSNGFLPAHTLSGDEHERSERT